MKKQLSVLSFFMVVLCAPSIASANEADMQKVLQQIEALQVQIDSLKEQVKVNNKVAGEATQAAEIAVEAVETAGTTNAGLNGISLGGYGELHYNNLDSGDSIDFHRFVLFFGKEFNDRLRFFSELEVEHAIAGEGQPGEVELEQAYIQYDFSDNTSATAGLFLVPVGILNETHEPPTFFGVERNGVEKEIIPSTWWEAGAMLSGRTASGFSYDVALHSGLSVPTEGKNAFRIRSGRQKVAKANASDFAITSRVRYTGVAGLELALSAQHQSDITQGLDDISATLLEAHAVYQTGPFGLRALYANWDIDGVEAEVLGKDKQDGFYIEPSYSFNQSWSVFARYGEYNNTAGFSDSEPVEQFDFGVNWNLHENVVIKFDVQNQDGAKDNDGFNVGVGYQF